MPTQFTSLAGCKREANLQKTDLVSSVAHLFKSSIVPTPSTPLVALLADECDFDGYVPITIAAWTGPYLAPGTPGYMIVAPILEWVYASAGPNVSNAVAGYFLVNSNGDLIDVVIFDAPINMSVNDQVIAYTPIELFAAG